MLFLTLSLSYLLFFDADSYILKELGIKSPYDGVKRDFFDGDKAEGENSR